MRASITAVDRTLIKGAIRRAFAQSELHKQVIERTRVADYHDPERPRVKKWSRCEKCQRMTPTYQIDVDHIDPIIPTDRTFADMSLDETVDRVWCGIENLQGICPDCHDAKTKVERDQRTASRRAKKALR